jgi:hypothetical protein
MSHSYSLRVGARISRPFQIAPASMRLLVGILVAYTLLVVGDVASTLVALADMHPMWRGEWNPLVSGIMRRGGTGAWLIFEAVCLVVPWVLSTVVWRFQDDWSMERAPRAQALIRRLVLVPLVVLCLWRAGAVTVNVARAASDALGPGPSGGPGLVTAATQTAVAEATATAAPSPTAVSSPTSPPHPTATPRPPTPVPQPSLSISPTPPGPVTACAPPQSPGSFTLTYVGAHPASFTVTSSAADHYQVSLDGNGFQPSVSGQITPGSTVRVWVQAQYAGAHNRSITISVAGFSQQTLTATTSGGSCGG